MVWRVHRNAVIPITFLAIPKGTFRSLQEMHVLIYIQAGRKYDDDVRFRKFKRQMYHDSIAAVLSPLKSGMIIPMICRCPDGHFRCVKYDLASYIADYPEQVYLAGVVQHWCPKYEPSFLHYPTMNNTNLLIYRCLAFHSNLDCPAGRRSHEHTKRLKEIIDSKMLWDEYGIDDDITVRHTQLVYFVSHKGTAIHHALSSCRHSRDVVP